jgi:WD40 repeat protein
VLATAEADGTVRLWNAAGGAPAKTLGPPSVPVNPKDHDDIELSFLGQDRVRLCTGYDKKRHLTVYDRSSGRALFERDGCGAPSPDGERLVHKTVGHLEIVDARTGSVQRRIDWTPGVQGEGERWAGGGRFVTWMEGTPRGDHAWSGHTLRALRVADGALLWMALLDGPDGSHLVAQGEGGVYAGPSATCLPGPPAGRPPSLAPNLVAAFFAERP